MPVAIVATPGAVDANSYTTEAEALVYHENHAHGEDWATATTDARVRALITATRLIDEHYVWLGMIATWTQALAWPRIGMLAFGEVPIPSTVIPAKLKEATAELARQLLAGDRTADSDPDVQGLKSLKAGDVALEFRSNVTVRVIPDAVLQMLRQWGSDASGRGVRQLVRA